jgi:hypothetical protein
MAAGRCDDPYFLPQTTYGFRVITWPEGNGEVTTATVSQPPVTGYDDLSATSAFSADVDLAVLAPDAVPAPVAPEPAVDVDEPPDAVPPVLALVEALAVAT